MSSFSGGGGGGAGGNSVLGFGGRHNVSAEAAPPWGELGGAMVTNNTAAAQMRAPFDGTIGDLHLIIDTAASNGAGNGYRFEIFINNVASGVAVELTLAEVEEEDTVNTAAVSQGDQIELRASNVGSGGAGPSGFNATVALTPS